MFVGIRVFAVLVEKVTHDDVSEHFHLEAEAEQAGPPGSLVAASDGPRPLWDW